MEGSLRVTGSFNFFDEMTFLELFIYVCAPFLDFKVDELLQIVEPPPPPVANFVLIITL